MNIYRLPKVVVIGNNKHTHTHTHKKNNVASFFFSYLRDVLVQIPQGTNTFSIEHRLI